MANRYWIGTGNWDTTNTANWSTASGGSGGASVPTTADAVFFDAGSAGGVCTITATASCASLNCTNFTGTLAGASQLNCYGSFALDAGMTYTRTGVTSFGGVGNRTITCAGFTIGSNVNITTSSIVTFTDDLICTGSVSQTAGTVIFNGNVSSSLSYTFSVGTITLNGNLTCTTFTASGTGVKTFNANAAVITLSGTGTVWNYSGSNLTFNRGTSKIALSNTTTTARTFAGGGLTYYNLEIGGATGISTLTITGSNTFNTISSTKTVAHTLRLTAGTTTTVTNWNINGTSGNQFTLNSATPGSQATLAKAGGGTVSVNYTTVQDIIGSPTSTWSALTSNGCVDGGNNTGWTFSGGATNYTLSCAYGTYTVTGYSSTLKVARFLSGSSGSYALTGQSANLVYSSGHVNYSLSCAAGSYSLAGQSATLSPVHKYSLTCSSGSYALTGQSVTLIAKHNYSLSCANGAYSIAGQSATLRPVHKNTLICSSGSYSVSGQTANLSVSRRYALTCASGAYTVVGQSVILKPTRKYSLTCAAGNYLVSGQLATLKPTHNYRLSCANGNYALSGQSVTLVYSSGKINYTLSCGFGVYSIAGKATTLTFNRKISLLSGAYSVTGYSATLKPVYNYSLLCQAGNYTFNGQSAELALRNPAYGVKFMLNINQADYLESNVLTKSDCQLNLNQIKTVTLELK